MSGADLRFLVAVAGAQLSLQKRLARNEAGIWEPVGLKAAIGRKIELGIAFDLCVNRCLYHYTFRPRVLSIEVSALIFIMKFPKCLICNNFDPRNHEKSEERTSGQHLSLDISLSDLQSSCRYCTMLLSMASHFVPDLHKFIKNPSVILDLEENSAGNVQVIGANPKGDLGEFIALDQFHVYLTGNQECIDLPYLSHLGIHSFRSDSTECFEFIKRSLGTCISSHSNCTDVSNSLLPKRILNVGRSKGDNIFLFEPKGQRSQYAALSHCWGTIQPIRTTRNNFDDMRRSVSWNDLSRVFQDAIHVCRQLELEYLWIDSLCIVQDDTQDWEQESARMADYYQHAYLTISAASSPNGTVPFLTERHSKWWPQKFHFSCQDGTTSEVYARRHMGSSITSLVDDIGPLGTRAWVWQENVLSTRILHFTQSELVWDCRSAVFSEDGGIPRSLYTMRLPQQLLRYEKDPLNGWHELVTTYSTRQLTFESDRLPALSGIAARFEALTQSNYLAGLWQSHLPQDLCWAADNISTSTMVAQFPHTSYIAPSWAWPSVKAAVVFVDVDPDTPFVPAVTVEEVSCTVPGRNKFGQVSEGFLVLRGPLASIRISCLDPNDCWAYTIGEDQDTREPLAADCILTMVNGKIKRAVQTDTLAPFSAEAPCMLIGRVENEEASTVYALVMEEVGGGEYRRIGLAELDDDEWFQNAVEETIRVI